MSSPLGPVYIGSLNLPPKKFSIPAPLGFVELPTTTRAARSTRDVEMEAGWVAAIPATLVATPTAATLIASLAPRFLPDLAIPTSSPRPRVANVRFRASYARSPGRRQGRFDEILDYNFRNRAAARTSSSTARAIRTSVSVRQERIVTGSPNLIGLRYSTTARYGAVAMSRCAAITSWIACQ